MCALMHLDELKFICLLKHTHTHNVQMQSLMYQHTHLCKHDSHTPAHKINLHEYMIKKTNTHAHSVMHTGSIVAVI